MTKMKIYGPHGGDDYSEASEALFFDTHASPEIPLITIQDSFVVDKISTIDLALELQKKYPYCCIISAGNNVIALTTLEVGVGVPIHVRLVRSDGRSIDDTKSVVNIAVISKPTVAREIFASFESKYSKNRKATIDWYYKSSRGSSNISLSLEEPPPVLDEFYPYIGNVGKYFENYLKSSSTILFMTGVPGTGKTSLLRKIIYDNAIHTMVAYDPKVLEGDELFLSFLQARGPDLMVLEDSEEFLRKRDLENHLMAKFLNVSDGLVKPKDKKIIFTTNYREFKDIDQALLRPGRCYGMLEFRALTYEEAVIACKAAKLPIPTVKKDYTLAELFNQGTKQPQIRAVGF